MKALVVAAVVASTLVAASPSGASSNPRALWVWDGPVDSAIDVAQADGFDTLFVHAPPGFDPSNYSAFVDRAHSVGVSVYAMAGDPAWATERHAWSDWVAEVDDAAIFDGAVADVEPYLLAGWSDGSQRRLIESYLRSLDRAHKEARTIELVATVPFWWDAPEFDRKGQSLAERVVARSDGIVVMAYRDHAVGVDGIIEHAGTEIAVAAAAGKAAWVGVETADVGLDKVTFHEEGRQFMEGELALVEAEFGAEYSGIAVHHYGSWTTLQP